MTKRFLGCLVLLLLLVFPMPALAGDSAVNGNQVTIAGQAGVGQWVSLTVEREDGKRSYINQLRAGSDGSYQFRFSLDRGRYNAQTTSGAQMQQLPLLEVNSDLANPGGGNGGSPIPQPSTASISIRDDAGATILQNASWNWAGSCTILDALKGVLNQQNISYSISGEYVRSIAGLTEKKAGYPLSGWLFRINGIFPGAGAGSAIIHNGDQVEWLYTLDGGKDVGAPAVIANKPLEIIQETVDLSSQYEQALGKLKADNLVINRGDRMASAEVDKLRQVLVENRVDISKETGREGGILADSEVFLKIPEGALTQDTRITIKETAQDKPETTAVRLLSSIYEFGPDGLSFNHPVTMAIKLAITDDLNLDLLTPAWYDTRTGQWVKIPAVIDLKNGLIIFQIDHFTSFALIEKGKEIIKDKSETPEPTLSFDDIDTTFDWAREAIESLAARGIITGTGSGYEPARSISRAEILELLVRAKGINVEKADPGFIDVNENDWCYAGIATAARQGWISGYPDSAFRPFNPISRNEAACLLNRIFPPDTRKSNPVNTGFTDMDKIPGWAQEAVVSLRCRGILSGYPDGSFAGEGKLSRAEAAVIIYKLTQ